MKERLTTALRTTNETKEQIIEIEGQRSKIKWTSYLIVAYAEGFCEGENATATEEIEAWAGIIKTGIWKGLQGFFGRNTHSLINRGIIDTKGEIDWEEFDNVINEAVE